MMCGQCLIGMVLIAKFSCQTKRTSLFPLTFSYSLLSSVNSGIPFSCAAARKVSSHALGEAPPGCHYAKVDLSVVPGFGKDGEKGKMKEGL